MVGGFFLVLLSYVILWSGWQVLVTFRLAIVLRTPSTPSQIRGVPKAAIILAVRGPDPSLDVNIRALLSQIYPDYRLFVVVDHLEDPAWDIVERIRIQHPRRIQVSTLEKPLSTCSLKCSAMAQALSQLDATYEVVAFADGDVHVHQTWLRELVEPLADPRIGASTGNRWYLPSDAGLGSMSRYFWNVGVVVLLWMNDFVWPGSMAFRFETLNKMGMIAALRTSLFDGPAVVQAIRRAGLKVRFVPSVMIVNREQISLADFRSWVERQTVVGSAKKHNWQLPALNALHLWVCVFVPPVAVLIGSWVSEPGLLPWALIAAASYWGVMLLRVVALERAVRDILSLHQTELQWFSWPKAISAAPGLLFAHLIPMLALARAAVRRTVHWRGIVYEIRGPDDVRMLNYTPFREHIAPGRSVL